MSLSFATGGLLWALLALPLLYWLLRLLPPKPRVVDFPALRILAGLSTGSARQSTPPWWLVLLRVLMAGLVVVALAGPRLVPQSTASQKPMVLLIDNAWPAAAHWPDITRTAHTLLHEAAAQGRQMWLWALTEKPGEVTWQKATDWQDTLTRLQPQQQSLQLPDALTWLRQNLSTPAEVVLLSSGVTERLTLPTGQAGVALSRLYLPSVLPRMISDVQRRGDSLTVKVLSPQDDDNPVTLELRDLNHRILSRAGTEKTGSRHQAASLLLSGLPAKAGYVTLQGQRHIGAWWGLQNVGGQPRVQVVAAKQDEFPLLSSRYYIQNALEDTAQVRTHPNLPDRLAGLDVLITDQPLADSAKVLSWVRDGGVVISLAGEGWRHHTDSPLLPSPLRPQPRLLSGPLQLEGAMTLTRATARGPLAGVDLDPAALISQQWLPQNGWADGVETWLALQDDTPLVSARQEGRGWVVMLHTGVDAAWSTLALTGSFPGLLQRLTRLGLSGGVTEAPPLPWAPQMVFDVFGQPTATGAQSITAANTPVTPSHPIGFYGAPLQPHMLDGQQRLVAALPPQAWGSAQVLHYNSQHQSNDLAPWVMLAALFLLIVDTALRLELRRGAGGLLLFIMAGLMPLTAGAEDNAATTSLGWIPSGQASVDNITAAGLRGLSAAVNARTSITLGVPARLNPATDSLGLYPLILWPQVEGAPLPGAAASAALRAYVASGGILLVDSGTLLGEAPEQTKRLLNDIFGSSLVPLAPDHTLHRSFYLLEGRLIGRLGNPPLWRDTAATLARLLVARHDLAGAWATDGAGRALLPMSSGGEVAREMSLRLGINLVLYALLGDYKKDQLHVDTLLKMFEADTK